MSASVSQKVNLRRKRDFKENDNVVFSTPDVVVEFEMNKKKVNIEAFKTQMNDRIKVSKNEDDYSQLHWLSLGYPCLAQTTETNRETKLFHFSDTHIYTYVNMLTDYHKELFKQKIKQKYKIEIGSDQITNIILSRFVCKMQILCNDNLINMTGKVYDFNVFPLELIFNTGPKLNQNCLESQLNNRNKKISLQCEVSANSKLVKTNYFSINFNSEQKNELVNDLFGPASSVYVTRQQMEEFSSKIFSSMNVFEEYEMPEYEFNGNFIDDLIRQTSDHAFQQVPFEQAINGISKFNINDDLKADEISSEFSKIFDVKSNGSRQHIIANKENYEKLNERNKDEYGGKLAGSGFGFSLDASYNQANEKQKEWENSNKNLNDQLRELNSASDKTIEWKLDGHKIVPKSLKVSKINKSKFKKEFSFNKIRSNLYNHTFTKIFSLNTFNIDKNLSNFIFSINFELILLLFIFNFYIYSA